MPDKFPDFDFYNPPRWLVPVLIVVLVCVIVFGFMFNRADAQMPELPQFIRLQSDTDGLGFEYTSEYDYTNVRPMAWSDEHGLTEINGLGYMAEQWIDRETGNITNIYFDAASRGWYSLCFNQNPQREGLIYPAHMTCGAHWVERK